MKKVNLWWPFFSFGLLLLLASCQKEYLFDDPAFGEGPAEIPQEQPDTDGETLLTLYRVQGNELSKIRDYEVSGRYLDLQQDYALHLQMWDYFTRLIPIEERSYLSEFLVFEGNNDLQGFVEPLAAHDLSRWRMGLAIDAIGNLEEIDLRELFASVVIHEFGHILTLNSEQVDAGVSENNCSRFFTGEGCARSNAYINEIFDIGWADIYEEFLGTGEHAIYTRFYEKYQDRFVSDYAATNPGEDVAEVFTHFVVREDRPAGHSIAEQKILSLYAYPELVRLRADIRQNPAVRALRINNLRHKPCKKHRGHRLEFSGSDR